MTGQIDRLWGRFDYVKESSSFKEVKFKTFCRSVKTSCPLAENVNKTPDTSSRLCMPWYTEIIAYCLGKCFLKLRLRCQWLQFPNGTLTLFCSIHICVTYLNTQVGVADHFVKDVRECTAEILKDSSVKTSGMVRNLPQFFFPSSCTLKNKKIKE